MLKCLRGTAVQSVWDSLSVCWPVPSWQTALMYLQTCLLHRGCIRVCHEISVKSIYLCCYLQWFCLDFFRFNDRVIILKKSKMLYNILFITWFIKKIIISSIQYFIKVTLSIISPWLCNAVYCRHVWLMLIVICLIC